MMPPSSVRWRTVSLRGSPATISVRALSQSFVAWTRVRRPLLPSSDYSPAYRSTVRSIGEVGRC
jgi:hypothetical protein